MYVPVLDYTISVGIGLWVVGLCSPAMNLKNLISVQV